MQVAATSLSKQSFIAARSLGIFTNVSRLPPRFLRSYKGEDQVWSIQLDVWLFYYILRGTRDVWAYVGGFSMSCVLFLGTIHSQSQVILLGMYECHLLIGIGYRGNLLSYDYVSTCMILLVQISTFYCSCLNLQVHRIMPECAYL